ncbi:hypothetical protein LTR28_012772, partial [Elasticomyces elasticus]
GIALADLPFHPYMQPWGSWVAMVFFTFLALINGFNVFWPKNWSASSFLTAYVGIPIFLGIYFGHRLYAWKDPWAHDPAEVDLVTGMEDVLADETPKPVYDTWWKHLRIVFE